MVSELSTEAAGSWLSRVDAGGAEPAAVVLVAAWSDPGAGPDQGAAASAGPDPANSGRDGANAGPDPVFQANVRIIESGSQSPVGWRAPTSASRPSAVGRCAGSLVRQRSIRDRIMAGT